MKLPLPLESDQYKAILHLKLIIPLINKIATGYECETIKTELSVCINSIETFVNKAKDLLKLNSFQSNKTSFTILQTNPDYAVDLNNSTSNIWLYKRENKDSPWIACRKLESTEIMQAEDQEHYNIIIDGQNKNV